jgi:hypothetical protein
MRHSLTISCTAARIRPSFWSSIPPEPETEEKDVEREEVEENEDVEEAVSIAGSVDWREREVDMVDCDAGGVCIEGSSVGAVS